jgi:protein MPE1
MKPGAGRAARYVTGKMPVTAKNAGRREQAHKTGTGKGLSSAITQMNNAMTEEERMDAMFAAQNEQMQQSQDEIHQ